MITSIFSYLPKTFANYCTYLHISFLVYFLNRLKAIAVIITDHRVAVMHIIIYYGCIN